MLFMFSEKAKRTIVRLVAGALAAGALVLALTNPAGAQSSRSALNESAIQATAHGLLTRTILRGSSAPKRFGTLRASYRNGAGPLPYFQRSVYAPTSNFTPCASGSAVP